MFRKGHPALWDGIRGSFSDISPVQGCQLQTVCIDSETRFVVTTQEPVYGMMNY